MKILTLDIGGTTIKSGVFFENKIEQFKENPTFAHKGGAFVLENVKKIISKYSDYDAIGISSAGQININSGEVIYANDNIPGYSGIKLKESIQEAFQRPVSVDNDVNSAAIGEINFSGRKELLTSTVIFLTYGTGVGGSVAVNGEILRGAGFSAGEFGMMCFRREKGLAEYYENFASTTALVIRVSEIDPTVDSGIRIFNQLDRKEIAEILDIWIDDVVLGLVSLTHIFNPGYIIVGGGIMTQKYISEEICKRLKRIVMPSFSGVEVKNAKLGNLAGLYGAAYPLLIAG